MDHSSLLNNQKILITGASGFIGSQLRRTLSSSGAEIHAISRRKQNDEPHVHWWQGDLAEIETTRAIFRAIEPDYIFHLAGHAFGAPDLELMIPAFRNNLASEVNVLTVATELGCKRIIVAGSTEESDCDAPCAVPRSPYAASKWAGSAYARMFRVLYQLPVVNLQISVVYGPGEYRLGKLVPNVILALLHSKAPKLSSGERQIDWIYIEDVVAGLVAVAQAHGVEGSTIDLGSGKLVTVRELVEWLVNRINPEIQPLFGALPERPIEHIRTADVVSTYVQTGWRPQMSLENGLGYTIAWYKEKLAQGEIASHAFRSIYSMS